MKKLFWGVLLIIIPGICQSVEQITLSDPGKTLRVTVEIRDDGKIFYKLDAFGEKMATGTRRAFSLIEASPLGIKRLDQDFENLRLISEGKTKSFKHAYQLHSGKRLKNRECFNEKILYLENHAGSRLDLVFRMYDEGLAFRYVFPGTDRSSYTVFEELTGFQIPDGQAWLQPYDSATAYAPAYERNYEGPWQVGAASPGKEGWCFPALFKVNDHWLLITEANVSKNFFGSHLKGTSNGLYRVVPPEPEEAFGYGTTRATSTLPWNMPWRIIIVGNNPGEIGESNLAFHVSDPPDERDYSWVKPGRASWAWWSGYLDRSTDTPEKLKKFIDLAQSMGWEYSLVDAGWDSRKGVDLKELITYAKARNVKLLLWYNSGGPINRVNAGPRDLMYYPELREKEMKRISEMGISGIKVDFFGSDKQDFFRLYHEILEDAARYRLLVNFHGCTMPRGWQRSFPHLISSEAVKGEEAYIYHADFEKKSPQHNAILPYTRNVTGSMDYTVGAFSFQQVPHRTTFGHEIALPVIFESGIQHFADTPEVYSRFSPEIRSYLSDLPAAWDETLFLSGYPGRDVVIARRKGASWFIAGINGESKPKVISVDFSFMKKGKPLTALFIEDGESNNDLKTKKTTVTDHSTKNIKLLPFGGFAIMAK